LADQATVTFQPFAFSQSTRCMFYSQSQTHQLSITFPII
jgi:hypothetical protein